jgi:hypothetical protein
MCVVTSLKLRTASRLLKKKELTEGAEFCASHF